MSEWARDVMLAGLESKVADRTEATVLAELGLRTILLNLLFTVAKGEVMTAEQMQTVIERADAGKLERARKLLAAHVATAPELPSDMPARDNLRFGVSGASRERPPIRRDLHSQSHHETLSKPAATARGKLPDPDTARDAA